MSNKLLLIICIFTSLLCLCLLGGIATYIGFDNAQQSQVYYNQIALYYLITFFFCVFCISLMMIINLITNQNVNNVRNGMSNIYEQNYKSFYSAQIINQSFLISFSIIQVCDRKCLNMQDDDSYHFIISFYVSAFNYYLFSKFIFGRRIMIPNEQIFYDEGVLRCGYEIYYYILSFFVLFSYFYSLDVDVLPIQCISLSQVLIADLIYLFYSFTKIGFIINFFCLFLFVKGITTSIKTYENQDIGVTGQCIQIIVLINSISLLLILMYKFKRGFVNSYSLYRNQANQNIDYLAAMNDMPQRRSIQNQNEILQIRFPPATETELAQLQIIHYIPSIKRLKKQKKPRIEQVQPQRSLIIDINLIQSERNIKKYSDETIKDPYKKAHSELDLREHITQKNNEIQIEIENKKVCSICNIDFQQFEKIAQLNCRHIFHKFCIIEWLKIKNSCPLCRRRGIGGSLNQILQL